MIKSLKQDEVYYTDMLSDIVSTMIQNASDTTHNVVDIGLDIDVICKDFYMSDKITHPVTNYIWLVREYGTNILREDDEFTLIHYRNCMSIFSSFKQFIITIGPHYMRIKRLPDYVKRGE